MILLRPKSVARPYNNGCMLDLVDVDRLHLVGSNGHLRASIVGLQVPGGRVPRRLHHLLCPEDGKTRRRWLLRRSNCGCLYLNRLRGWLGLDKDRRSFKSPKIKELMRFS